MALWPPQGLAKPAHRALADAGIDSLLELARRSEADVASLHGMGARGIQTLRAALAEHGLSFRA